MKLRWDQESFTFRWVLRIWSSVQQELLQGINDNLLFMTIDFLMTLVCAIFVYAVVIVFSPLILIGTAMYAVKVEKE